MEGSIIFMLGLVLLVFLQMFFVFTRYKKVPPNKLLVIYGKVDESGKEGVKIIEEGGAFVWPVIQDFDFLDLSVLRTVGVTDFKTQNRELVQVDGAFNYAISKDEDKAKEAATRLLGKTQAEVKLIAMDLIAAAIEKTIAKYHSKEEVINDRTQINETAKEEASKVLEKIGIEMVLFEVKILN